MHLERAGDQLHPAWGFSALNALTSELEAEFNRF